MLTMTKLDIINKKIDLLKKAKAIEKIQINDRQVSLLNQTKKKHYIKIIKVLEEMKQDPDIEKWDTYKIQVDGKMYLVW